MLPDLLKPSLHMLATVAFGTMHSFRTCPEPVCDITLPPLTTAGPDCPDRCLVLQAALDDSIEHAREAIGSSHDLQGMQKAVSNAFGLYKRTRPPAAPESVARARGLPKEGIHPMLAAKVPVTAGTGLEAQVCLSVFLCMYLLTQ